MKDEHFPGLTARFKLERVDNVPATLSLTAPVSFWREAVQNLGGEGYGAWQVLAAIRSVISQAENSFYERVEPGSSGTSSG